MANQVQINSAVDEVLATRDFLGDERQAIKNIESDYKIKFTESERKEIFAKVNGTWKECQKACGAKILTEDERQRAYDAVENVEEW